MEVMSFSILMVACSAGAYLFSQSVPEPYMDEIFHVPQAQRYCFGNFSYWDPMITTPPGLYILSLLWATPLSYILRLPTSDLCTATFLRAQNVVCSLLLYLTTERILRLKSQYSKSQDWTALSLSMFPVLFFFSFLYYTDVGATLMVLWGYLLQTKGCHWSAALVLLVAVLFRQTSIVWIVFVAGNEVVTFIHKHMRQKGQSFPFRDLLVGMVTTWPRHLFLPLFPYMVVVALFLAFVVVNGSLALGDKTNHTLSFHLPQLFYFCLFTCFFAAPRLLFDWWRLVLRCGRGVVRNPWRSLLMMIPLVILVVAVATAVHFFTYAHPYLLADNRHYPFYLWKNVFRRHWLVKYLLSPVYVLAAAALILPLLARTRDVLWLLLFSVCCFTALVPQKLLEFRYYTIPYLIYRIQIETGKNEDAHTKYRTACGVFEFLLYSVVNLATIWLFVYKPYQWPDSLDWQRFMW